MPFATKTQFQIGTYNALTDTFTLVLDLNDGTTFQILDGSPDIQAPPRDIDRASNPRYEGEVIVRERYKNGNIKLEFTIRGANNAAITASRRSFMAAVNFPPYVIAYAEPGAANVSYYDVVACTHNMETSPKKILANVVKGKALFECKPYLRGPRQTLHNLQMNPGFEAPSGPQVQVFNDSFANVNAYVGAACTVAANVMTIPTTSTITFGSPAWGPINLWQIRFKFNGSFPNFCLHFTDNSNNIQVEFGTNSVQLNHVVAGTVHTLASATPTITNGTFYWLTFTQFPALSGNTPLLQATVANDSAGSLGTTIATLGPVLAFNAVTAQSGHMAIQTGSAALLVGGPQITNPTNYVATFGPGGLGQLTNLNTGTGSGAWDGTRAELGMSGTGVAGTNTYPNGPLTSFGAARLDFPPAGTVNIQWTLGDNSSLAQVKATAVPVSAPGNVLGIAWTVKATGLSATGIAGLLVNEYDSTGAFLRQTVNLNNVTGPSAVPWTAKSVNYTTGANCAYVIPTLNGFDSTANSANATVWFDNVQVWNQTTTGQATMPYCELRFPQSPAQLVVSGILGDVATSAWTALGTFYATPISTTALTFALGRKATLVPNAQLVTSGNDGPPALVLDSTAYNGFYGSTTLSGDTSLTFVQKTSDLMGVYHLLTRYYTGQIVGNLPNISAQFHEQSSATQGSLFLSNVPSNPLSPVTASAVWSSYDLGQLAVPSVPTGALEDPTQNWTYVYINWNDATGGSPAQRMNWHLLLPVDADIVTGILTPGPQFGSTTNSYWFAYADGAALSAGTNAAMVWSYETTALPNPAHAPGTTITPTTFGGVTYPALATNASPYMTLDPTVTNAAGLSVNQFGAYMTDQLGAVQAFICEMQYSPLYFYPR